MGYTNRKFITAEIAILVESYQDHSIERTERAKAGDIIVVRKPLYVVGGKEISNLLWLQIDGLEENEYAKLLDQNYDMTEYPWDLPKTPQSGFYFEKRRYFIPLNRLLKVCPWLDINRIKDPSDSYQPFMVLEKDDPWYHSLAPQKPLNVHGLIFDKLKGEYL